MAVVATLSSPVALTFSSGDDSGGHMIEFALPPAVVGMLITSVTINAVYDWFDAEPTAWRVTMYQFGGGISLESCLESTSLPLAHDPVVTATLVPAASVGMGTNEAALDDVVRVFFDTNASYGIGPVDGLGGATIDIVFEADGEPHRTDLIVHAELDSDEVTVTGVTGTPLGRSVVAEIAPVDTGFSYEGAMHYAGDWVAGPYAEGAVVRYKGMVFVATAATSASPLGDAVVSVPYDADAWQLNGSASDLGGGDVRLFNNGTYNSGNLVSLDAVAVDGLAVTFDAEAVNIYSADGFSVGIVPSAMSIGGSGNATALTGINNSIGVKCLHYAGQFRHGNYYDGGSTETAYGTGIDFASPGTYRVTFVKLDGSTVEITFERLSAPTFSYTATVSGAFPIATGHVAIGGSSGAASGSWVVSNVTVSADGGNPPWEQIGTYAL